MLQQESETRKTMLFNRMPQEQCDVLEKVGEEMAYPAGTVIHAQGETLQGVLVVQKGTLRLIRSTGPTGKEKTQVVDIAKPGQVMGEVQLLTDLPAIASAIANEDAECLFIPADALLPILRSDPVVANVFLWHLAQKVRRMVPLIEDLGLHTVPERVAKLILYFHGDAPDRNFIEFRDTQEGLAHYIGSSREALNRGLKTLGELGFVHNSYPVVHILDEDGLRRFSDGL